MKIAYNPKTAAALTAAPSNNDITFDLKGVAIYAKGVKFKGTDTTYSVFKKHTASGNTGGYNGLVPVPSYTATTDRFLREDGSWVIPTNTTYSVVSSTTNGLAPKIGTAAAATIATQADEWVLTSTKGGTPTWRKLPTNAFKNDNTNTTYTLSGGLSGNNYTVTLTPSSGNATIATIPVMTAATSSAAGKAGLVPAPAANKHTSFLRGDGTWATPSDTHYTTHLYIGAKDAASNAATTNGNTYIKITDNSTIRNQYIIKGSGITAVASDANGNITINTPASHNLPTSDINKLTGYTIATSAAALTTTDTLNAALGKLEYKLNVAYDLVTKANDKDGTIENLKEILDVLSGISDTETIKALVGKYLPLAGGTMTLGEGLKFHADENYFGTNLDARIISLLDGNGTICDGGLIIDERCTSNGTTTVTELLRIRDSEFKWRGNNILHAGNYSSILDSRYYTETEANDRFVNITGDTMTGPLNFANGTWNSVGDDAAIGDYNAAGMLGLKSLNNDIPGVGFHNSSGTLLGRLQAKGNNLYWNDNLIIHGGNNSLGYIGTTAVQASGAALALTGINSITFTPLTGNNGRAILYQSMGDNDQFRIYCGATASNGGWVEIATADDGTEPIYVRQYTGVFTTLKRTATLLDASGNTSFPGYVTSTGFIKSGSNDNYALMGGGGHKQINNVLNTAFYKRVTTINGSGWDMAGTANSAAFTIYAPTTAGTSNYILKSNGSGAPTWIALSSITAGDSDKLDGYDSSRFLRAKDWVNNPGLNANTLELNMMCFTYSNNAPHTGTIIYFSGATGGSYGLLLNASYSNSENLSFRSRNGDKGTWNDWRTLLHNGNSSVSGGGSSWGSSITVKINGTSKTLTIPSNPNTHWTTRIYAGASGTAANAAATNPYLKVTDDNTYRNLVRFVGGGATTVSSNANGDITISSTNTTYSFAATGSATKGIYLSATNTFKAMTYSLNATVNSGTTNKLAYYSGNNAISAHTDTVGSSVLPIYLNAGVPTACSVPMVRYWAIYSINNLTYTKQAGNISPITSIARMLNNNTGAYCVYCSFPTGYSFNTTMIWGAGSHESTTSTPSERGTLYVSVTAGADSYFYVRTSNDSTTDNGQYRLFFLCIG